jgi:DNA-binding HxlR family transcriptional regulator
MSNEQFDTLLQFFKVLGNESRLKILGLLANDERSVGELATLLELREPTVSHHLAAMKELGLVDVRADGNVRFYILNTNFLEDLNKDVFSQDHLASLVSEPTGDAWENRILSLYLDGETIKEIPMKRKKQRVILKWLVQKFEMDRKYHELELNERLRVYNPDVAALRRYMVEEQLMARDNQNIYWRLPLEETD